MSRERFVATDVLVLAGGLKEEGGLNPETIRRTDTAAQFVLAQKRKIDKIIVSGGYPLGREAPDEANREGTLMAKRLKEEWGVESVDAEIESRTTVENFANVIRDGHLTPGEYAEGRRALAIVTNELHGRRAGLLARTALAAADNSVFRVAVPGERRALREQVQQERELAQLVAIAIDLAQQSHPSLPLNLGYVNEEFGKRTPEQWKEAVGQLNAEQPNWELPDLPTLSSV